MPVRARYVGFINGPLMSTPSDAVAVCLSIILFGLAALGLTLPAQAQTDAELQITLKNDTALEEKGRQQLLRLLSTYDLDPWIYTEQVVIESYVIPHSHPVLTLNTKHVNDDLRQLSTFVHEQMHWLEEAETNKAAVECTIAQFRERYPQVPVRGGQGARSEYSTYLHLIVCWLEFDGMAELVGEDIARQILADKEHYQWIYARVLQDTAAIGQVLAEEGLLVTPERGITIRRGG